MDTLQLVNDRKAAKLLTVHPGTLRLWRCQGRGPTYIKLGRAVRYRLSDIETFIAESKRNTRAMEH